MGILETKCQDCGAREGALHDRGCDRERCPFCGEQLLACGCGYKKLGFDYDRDELFCGLPIDIYHNGLPEDLQEKWNTILEEKGRVPYIHYPRFCARCGKKYPAMHMIPDWEWDRYIAPLMRDSLLCKECLEEIKALIDEHAGLPEPKMIPCPECSDKKCGGDSKKTAFENRKCPVCRGREEIAENSLRSYLDHKAMWAEMFKRYKEEERIEKEHKAKAKQS